MTTQSHFAKYLNRQIYNKETGALVELKGVRKDYLMYQNGQPTEEKGEYDNFLIVVNSSGELIGNNVPEDLACMISAAGEMKKVKAMSPDIFLTQLKDILYPMFNTNELEMSKDNSKKTRKGKYVELRQVIMATYFCAWEHNESYRVSLKMAADLYGKDHATVLHCIKKVNNMLDTEKSFRDKYRRVWDLVLSINKCSRLHIR